MNKHNISDLYQMQSLPLSAKIRMTEYRINQWIEEYGNDGVYVAFSGGKDSTVLLDIIRNRMRYDDIPAVFVDVPTQFPELKEYALTWNNVTVLKPKISFMEVCEKYGFPLIGKEVSDFVNSAKKNLRKIANQLDCFQTENIDWDKVFLYCKKNNIKMDVRTYIIYGQLKHKEKGIETDEYSRQYDRSRWKFLLYAPFDVSGDCCRVMKKAPLNEYVKQTKRVPITAQMASESRLRTQQWMKNGCNMYDAKHPISNPMSFWTEQDILQYIRENNLKICSVYGNVVTEDEENGQVNLSDFGICELDKKQLKTTGCKRTGCMLCGFGCHLEKKGEERFLLMKKTHPKMYDLMDVIKNNGVTMREAIEWINQNSDAKISL